MRAALQKMGAPEDLVIGIETPSLETTNELMRQCDLVLATGGGAMVHAAYSSGSPALGRRCWQCLSSPLMTRLISILPLRKFASQRHWI
jgi:hypothetical protein